MSDREMKVFLNGEFVLARDAKVSVFDHSFLYGDGVFEGIRVDAGKIFKLAEHVARLYRSAQYISIAIPMTQEEMCAAIVETVRENDLSDGYLRPLVTRGEGPLGIEATRSLGRPNIVVLAQIRSKFDESVRLETGLRAKIVSVRRNSAQSIDPRIKSCNYLNNILGKLEQWSAGAEVGIMLDVDGMVSEGCSENLFGVSRGVLVTPPSHRTLEGITRETIITDLAPSVPIEVKEKDLTPYDLYTADELFVSGTLTEVVPVVEVDGRSIGDGKPGKVTIDLLKRLRTFMEENATPAL